MKRIQLIIAAGLVGVLVALVYLLFEWVLAEAIQLFWYDWLDVERHWWLVVPFTVLLTYVYFGVQHLLDAHSEAKEHALAETPRRATLRALVVVLTVGFLSLFAGASLGPEAVLIPAVILVGQLVAMRWIDTKPGAALLAGTGFVALFVAFFSSLLGGVLGLYLLKKTKGVELNAIVVAVLSVAALTAFITLQLLERHFFAFPPYTFTLSLPTMLWLTVLLVAGYVMNVALRWLVDRFHGVHALVAHDWRRTALVASLGLSLIYLVGGPHVQFTGNEAIAPVYSQAAEIGLAGLLVIIVTKVLALAWSHAMGYRGGLVFPVLLVGSAVSAIVSLYAADTNPMAFILVFLVGALAADRRTHVIVEQN